jgi:hypothetical protein
MTEILLPGEYLPGLSDPLFTPAILITEGIDDGDLPSLLIDDPNYFSLVDLTPQMSVPAASLVALYLGAANGEIFERMPVALREKGALIVLPEGVLTLLEPEEGARSESPYLGLSTRLNLPLAEQRGTALRTLVSVILADFVFD